MLSIGCTGEEVRQLQEKLIALGYGCGSSAADGNFGNDTYNSVIQFQKDHGLSTDGIVGPDTLNSINSAFSSSSNLNLLKQGSNGQDVLRLQQTLISLGYNTGGADGDFGPGTYNAVVQFQKDHGLSVDGIVGPNTWTVLNSTTGGSSNSSLLKQGSNGKDVIQLQERLISLGYSCGSAGADGDFGVGTYNAVVQFQGDHGLSVDGIVGPATWAALNAETGSPSSSALLKQGSTGDTVRVLQEKLVSLGYSTNGVDGDFGTGTYNAVVQFQGDHGLSVDGIVGPATWAALNSANGSTNYSTLLKQGSTGQDVIQLQQKLVSLGYNTNGVDGDFGTGTYNAVLQFQRDHGLSADGIVGPATWAALNSLQGGSGSIVVGGAGVAKFIAVAKQELAKGFRENNGNNMTPYGAWYGLNGEPWCAMFVSWCANQAGILNTIVPRYAYCPTGVSWYANRGRYRFRVGYTPKPGDVIFFQEGGISSHTGIVISYDSGARAVTTIEGNASDAVIQGYHSIDDSYILGFGDDGGVAADNSNINMFKAYNMESKYGFANIFDINLSTSIKQTICNSPFLKVTFSAGTQNNLSSGILSSNFTIKGGKIGSTDSFSSKISAKFGEIGLGIGSDKIASLSSTLLKLGDGDINLSIKKLTPGPKFEFSGTISFHNKLDVYDFYQNLDFEFVFDTNYFIQPIVQAMQNPVIKAVTDVALAAGLIALVVIALPAEGAVAAATGASVVVIGVFLKLFGGTLIPNFDYSQYY